MSVSFNILFTLKDCYPLKEEFVLDIHHFLVKQGLRTIPPGMYRKPLNEVIHIMIKEGWESIEYTCGKALVSVRISEATLLSPGESPHVWISMGFDTRRLREEPLLDMKLRNVARSLILYLQKRFEVKDMEEMLNDTICTFELDKKKWKPMNEPNSRKTNQNANDDTFNDENKKKLRGGTR